MTYQALAKMIAAPAQTNASGASPNRKNANSAVNGRRRKSKALTTLASTTRSAIVTSTGATMPHTPSPRIGRMSSAENGAQSSAVGPTHQSAMKSAV